MVILSLMVAGYVVGESEIGNRMSAVGMGRAVRFDVLAQDAEAISETADPF